MKVNTIFKMKIFKLHFMKILKKIKNSKVILIRSKVCKNPLKVLLIIGLIKIQTKNWFSNYKKKASLCFNTIEPKVALPKLISFCWLKKNKKTCKKNCNKIKINLIA